MKTLKMIILSVSILAVTLVPTVALAQTTKPTPQGLQASIITGELVDPAFLLVLLVALVAGAIGGVVYELLILQGNIEWPHKLTEKEVTENYPYAVARYMFDLGIWARVVIGGLAAVAALLILSPSTAFGLVATAVIAGSAGTSVFRSMQDRLLAAMSQKKAADTEDNRSKIIAKVDEVTKAVGAYKLKVMGASSSLAGVNKSISRTDAALDLEDLTHVERLLSEAKGVYESIQR